MKHWSWPVMVFVFVCVIGIAARQAIGQVYSSGEAITLIETLSKSGLYLGSATATASATTLALMLTLIGTVRRSDEEFGAQVYQNIGRIARLATASLMTSLVLLLVLVFPVGEFDDIPANWYPIMYEVVFAATILTVGLLAATVSMLYRTIHRVIAHLTPGEEE